MSSSACQELQSCLVGTADSSWLRNCFFQSPSTDPPPFVDAKAPEYVHLLTKRRWSTLSEKSLEMCTESLGSETGTHVGDYDVSPERKTRPEKMNRVQSFPPPLKSAGLHVTSRREGGRLVLEAVTAAEWKSVFHVERSDGRITVVMVRDWEETAVEDTAVTAGDVEVAEVMDDDGERKNGEGEGMEGNIGIVEGDLGIEKIERRRRCMESQRWSNEGFLKLNWEPFMVTI